jgi:hypothetical protein
MFSASSCSPAEIHILLPVRRYWPPSPSGGAGGDVRQAGTGLRLGQAHGAEEAAFQHRIDEALDLLRRAGLEQGVGVAHGQEGVGRRADVGGREPRRQRLLDHRRQLHAAAFVVLPGRHQAGGAEGIQRRLHLGDDLHLAIHHMRLVLVGLLVVRANSSVASVRRYRARRRKFRGCGLRSGCAWSAPPHPAIHTA